MGLKTLRARDRRACPGQLVDGVVADPHLGHAPPEVARVEGRREARRAAGREDVIRARDVVAERGRAGPANEQAACAAHGVGVCLHVCADQLEVLGSEGVGEGDRLAGVSDLNDCELGLADGYINYLYPAYLRGQAYLLTHNGAAAATEFQKLLDHQGIVQNFVTGSLAHLQIGRAYTLSGDTAKAKAAYQTFLNLWKDADPDIPILKQAKAEFAKLQ